MLAPAAYDEVNLAALLQNRAEAGLLWDHTIPLDQLGIAIAHLPHITVDAGECALRSRQVVRAGLA